MDLGPGNDADAKAGRDRDRTERWDALMHRPVLGASLLFVPTLFLHYSQPPTGWIECADALDWVIWATFAVDVLGGVMLSADRRGFARHHWLAVFVACFAFPALPEIFDVVPGLYVVALVGGFEIVHVAKLAEAAGVVRTALARSTRWASVAWGLFLVVTGVIVLAVVGVMVDADRAGAAPTPLHYASDVAERLTQHPTDARMLVLGVVATTFFAGMVWACRPSRLVRAPAGPPAPPSPRSGR